MYLGSLTLLLYSILKSLATRARRASMTSMTKPFPGQARGPICVCVGISTKFCVVTHYRRKEETNEIHRKSRKSVLRMSDSVESIAHMRAGRGNTIELEG